MNAPTRHTIATADAGLRTFRRVALPSPVDCDFCGALTVAAGWLHTDGAHGDTIICAACGDHFRIEIRYEHCPALAGMAWVIYRGGKYEGAAHSEAGARQSAILVIEFGYFDPTEARQRARIRELEAVG